MNIEDLYELARLWKIQTSYVDAGGVERVASPEALLAVLAGAGAPVRSPGDVSDALRARRQELRGRMLEPVLVAWEGEPFRPRLRVPDSVVGRLLRWSLRTEDGRDLEGEAELGRGEPLRSTEVEGARYGEFELGQIDPPPIGTHRLVVEVGGRSREATVLAAPRRAGRGSIAGGSWGLFLPLYALTTRRSWGAGDYTDLERLLEWGGEVGARVVGTLPLLAAFLDEPYGPSPYSPASRLAWNEFYVDPESAPEWEGSAYARALWESARFREELAHLRDSALVDYPRLYALKRQVLEALATDHYASDTEAFRARREFEESRPIVADYARFRAALEARRLGWPDWPAAMAAGRLADGDYDENARRYHVYAQWLCHEQLLRAASRAKDGASELYLDLPLGVHPHGYDTWRERTAFASGVACGAPPDPFFEGGQNWGFPPLSPNGLRATGYRYLAETLAHHLEIARVLRIDHAAGLHRLYWVPNGFGPQEGVYVEYPAEEIYAVTILAARRNEALLVGEDLGTVPESARRGLEEHGIDRMYVLPFELQPDRDPPLAPIPPGTLSCLGTHDLPPFAGWWDGLDRSGREALRRALGFEGDDAAAAFAPSLEWLARSSARLVLVNLEDLWLETRPQNHPGTSFERPNWVRKARYPLEAFLDLPSVRGILQVVQRARTPPSVE